MVSGIEEAGNYYVDPQIREEMRWEELNKIASLNSYQVISYSSMPQVKRILDTRWLDTMTKSRLTIRDFKVFGDQGEIVHCPTPSFATHRAFEARAVERNEPVAYFDVVSAFPRALESRDNVVKPPQLSTFISDYIQTFLKETNLFG